jgi:alpha-L-fucosidase
LSGLRNDIDSAYFLVDKSTNLQVINADDKTTIALPLNAPDSPLTVIVLQLDGSPRVNPHIVRQEETSKIELNYLTAITHGKAKTRYNRKGGFHISKWTGPEDTVEWIVNIDKPGRYQVNIDYAAGKVMEGKPFEIIIGNSQIEKTVNNTGDWFEYHEFPVGDIELTEAGE